MRHDTTCHTVSIIASGAIFMDGTLPPLFEGDVISVSLIFDTDVAQSAAGVEVHDVTVRPDYGLTPLLGPDRVMKWYFTVTGDGWTARWLHHSPFAGRLRVPGRLWPEFGHAIPGHPETTTGRVRRLQLVEEKYESTPEGRRRVPGSERVSDLGSSPDRVWPHWRIFPTDEEFQATAIVVDLDLDDVPDALDGFNAGAIAASGADVWVMDKSNPTLIHIDTSSTPHQVTEYLLPLMISEPIEMWSRRVHADANGCWITARDEIVRCNRDGPTELTLRRVTTDGGNSTVTLGDRVFVMTCPESVTLLTERYGKVRVAPDRHPVRELINDELVPVTDEATIARVRAGGGRADTVTTPDGATWTASQNVTLHTADGHLHAVDLQPRTLGRVNWVRPNAWSGTGVDPIAPGTYAPLASKPEGT